MTRFFVPALALGLVACTPGQIETANSYQAKIAGACTVAMTLVPVAGPMAPWILGACGADDLIAKVALDSSTLEWLNGMVAKIRR